MIAPAISVVLATRDRDYVLAHTLAHMARVLSRSASSVEVIVVDNGSSDSTPDVLSYFARHLPLVPCSEPKEGKNRALTRALELSRGDLIVFTDDDVIPEAGWLDGLEAASRRWADYEIFGGRIVPRYPPGSGPPFSDDAFGEWAYSAWAPQADEGPTDRLPLGPNFAVRSSALKGISLDEDVGPGVGVMGSETTLLLGLVARGCKIVYVPTSTVHHLVLPHQLEPGYLRRRAYRLGRGIVRWGGDTDAPRWAGVPRYLWREVVESWVRARFPLSDPRTRLKADLDHERARGEIAELRRTRS